MMLEKLSLSAKIQRLEEFVKAIKKLQKTVDKKKFLTDDIVQKAIERYLQLAIEAGLDISSHLIGELGLRKPEDYKESILILGENGILPRKFAQHFSLAAGFRNIMVHDYLRLDKEKVYEHFKKDAADLEKFMKYVAKRIDV